MEPSNCHRNKINDEGDTINRIREYSWFSAFGTMVKKGDIESWTVKRLSQADCVLELH